MSEPTRYRVANNQAQLTLGGGILAVDPAGPLVEYADYARLKEKSACQAEALNAFDKKLREAEAEVERLNTGIQPEGSNDAVGRAVNVLLEKGKEIARLKAEVERLRKAGDGMEEVIWLNGCVSGMEIKERAVKAWKQAKEGKV